jgi:hypothetical protein
MTPTTAPPASTVGMATAPKLVPASCAKPNKPPRNATTAAAPTGRAVPKATAVTAAFACLKARSRACCRVFPTKLPFDSSGVSSASGRATVTPSSTRVLTQVSARDAESKTMAWRISCWTRSPASSRSPARMAAR